MKIQKHQLQEQNLASYNIHVVFGIFQKKHDQKVIDAKFVFCGPCVPMVTRRKGYQFEKDQIAINIFKDWKYGNDPMNPFVFHFTLHFF